MATTLSVKYDDREVRELLERFTEPETKKILRKASTKAGAAMKRVVRPAVPRGKTGNLAGAVRAKRISANTAIGVVVGPMGSKASHRHLVAGGTRPHIIRPRPPRRSFPASLGFATVIRHPGAKPNRWLDRVDAPAYAAGHDAAELVIDEALR